MWPISEADSLAPRHSREPWTNPPPMPVPTRIPTTLSAPRAAPSHFSPSVPRLQSLPSATGILNGALQPGANGDAGKLHVGRHDHVPDGGVDDAGDRDADGRRFRGAGQSALGQQIADGPLDGLDDRLGPHAAWAQTLLSGDHQPGRLDRGGLNVGPADVDRQIEVAFSGHVALLAFVRFSSREV